MLLGRCEHGQQLRRRAQGLDPGTESPLQARPDGRSSSLPALLDVVEIAPERGQFVQRQGVAPGLPDHVPLRHCPFREGAEEHRDTVCSLHLGLIRGALKEVPAPLGVDRLDPFVEPSLCLAHLSRADEHRAPDRAA
ncbi:hypothetical protein ACFYVV_10585 [Streptomyces tendae]|uniref:hypothetical protein n=1 Tax=Streptomyces tendae TaxID=1932 RepID=UPI0036A09416